MLSKDSKQPFPQESKSLEYKEKFTHRLKREICAFLNNNLVNGINTSYIYIGVNDNSRKLTKSYTSAEKHSFEEKLSSWATNAFYPEATAYVTSYTDNDPFCIKVTSPNDQVFTVQEGTHPHPSLYIRSGSSSTRSNREMFRRLIGETHPKSFDKEISGQQKLTFYYLAKIFKRKKGKVLHLKGLSEFYTNGKYSNTALVFSDQNPYITKSASFLHSGSGLDFTPRRFTGSILKQIDDLTNFVNYKYNDVKYIITGAPQRTERWNYPKRAIREAIVNTFAHRSYFSLGEFSEVNNYKDHLEIQSPGEIPDGHSPKQVEGKYMSDPRNLRILSVLHRVKYADRYGSGLPRIISLYKRYGNGKHIKMTTNEAITKLILPNTNSVRTVASKNNSPIKFTDSSILYLRILPIITVIKRNGYITTTVIKKIYGMKRSTATYFINKLIKKRILKRTGYGRGTKYKFPK